MAKAVAGCWQFSQARLTDRPPAGFAPPIAPLFQAPEGGIDVVEVTTGPIEQSVAHLRPERLQS
jgi:hypothetical protein